MDNYMMWSPILLELSIAVSGEQELGKLVKKAASAFLRKLNCVHVSVLQDNNGCLEAIYVVPRVTLKNPAIMSLLENLKENYSKKRTKT